MRVSGHEQAPRAGIVVTGTEVLSGRRSDRNGPWLSARLREAGIELTHVTIVGDRREDVLSALRFMVSQELDLVITSGGLGPTADDLTADVVAELQGLPMVLDEELERRIGRIVGSLRERFPNVDLEALAAGTRKQATIPLGAIVLDPVGTAPGLVVPPAHGEAPIVLVLPGPPRELQPMWRVALETPPLRALLSRATELREDVLRIFGVPESELAATLRDAQASGIALTDLEVTTCLHRGELEVTTSYEPQMQDTYDAFAAFLSERYAGALFSSDGSTVDEQVAALLLDASLTIAVAESCTGGLLAARLTDMPGSSRYMLGGVVAYSNDVKVSLASVSPELIERHGSVSQEVAEALADGARSRLDTDVGVGITGIAGPDGGTPEKPVGLVWLSVVGGAADARVTRSVQLPGSRADIRELTTTIAMHLIRRLLSELDAAAAAAERGHGETAERAPKHSMT